MFGVYIRGKHEAQENKTIEIRHKKIINTLLAFTRKKARGNLKLHFEWKT